jgi:biopolymer transport protein ExbD
MTAELEAARARDASVRVLVRAPRGERFDLVRPALEAVSAAGIHRVDLSIEPIAAVSQAAGDWR